MVTIGSTVTRGSEKKGWEGKVYTIDAQEYLAI